MFGFLRNAACEGRRPSHLASCHHYPRPDLIARLLRERHVARFLVAPDGFGKSALVMEYCEIVFSYKHVFWVRGQSPCFLRDLDRGNIAEELIQIDPEAQLVVFDDILPLNTKRAAMFSRAIDELLKDDCEVMVTCVPSCDFFESRQRDRLRLSGSDLLLSDVEIDDARSVSERHSQPASSLQNASRVAGLWWAEEDAHADFLARAMREELPCDVLLSMASMLVIGKGTLADVKVFGSCDEAVVSLLAQEYPHLGIDRGHENFSSPDFTVGAIAEALTKKLDVIADQSCFCNRDTLVMNWADTLLAHSMSSRACELVGALCSRTGKAQWLSTHSGALMQQVCVLPAHKLYCSLKRLSGAQDACLELGEVLRLLKLGDQKAAIDLAKKLAFNLKTSYGIRALANLVLARIARDHLRTQAGKELKGLMRTSGNDALFRDEREQECGYGPNYWRPLVWTHLSLARMDNLSEEEVLTWFKQNRYKEALVVASTWILIELVRCGQKVVFDRQWHKKPLAVCAQRFISRQLRENEGEYNLYLAAAAGALEKARGLKMFLEDTSFSAEQSLALHHVNVEMLAQQHDYNEQERARSEYHADKIATHPDAYLDGRYLPKHVAVKSIVPTLTINLFGGLTVRRGDELVETCYFNRQKVKTLLALLVINRCRELPRDRLVQELWPQSELETARKNFYSIWSLLRRALAGPSNTCPYLIKYQNACRLDDRLIVTDLARFDAICRSLSFDKPHADGWSDLYTEIDESFADDLLPSEQENESIVKAREECRAKIVDAMVRASGRLVETHNAQEGLWFARAALRRDRTREDAYTALMNAQLAAGQRTSALETYFTCRRFLVEELGMDPSLKTMSLYRSIIETEETMD